MVIGWDVSVGGGEGVKGVAQAQSASCLPLACLAGDSSSSQKGSGQVCHWACLLLVL